MAFRRGQAVYDTLSGAVGRLLLVKRRYVILEQQNAYGFMSSQTLYKEASVLRLIDAHYMSQERHKAQAEAIMREEQAKDGRKIFVFGSNLAGIHGAGAALFAKEHHGAITGVGVGIQGDSYAIPTKDSKIKTLPLALVSDYVEQFKAYARLHPKDCFWVTRIGCGLAGYTDAQIKPLFAACPKNCILPKAWGGQGFSE